VEELEHQFDDTHSRGAFCRIVSDHGLGEDVAYRLLRETLEKERDIKGPLGAYVIDACTREAQRQDIHLGFNEPATVLTKGTRRGPRRHDHPTPRVGDSGPRGTPAPGR
jgi:hypothetical protein